MYTATNILLALTRYDHRTHKGVAKFAAENGWHLNSEMAITGKFPENWDGDGIVALLGEEDELVRQVLSKDCPFVDLSILRTDVPSPRVTADNEAIGQLAAEYYRVKGFKNFGFFSITDDKVAMARLHSFYHYAQVSKKRFSQLVFGGRNNELNKLEIANWLAKLAYPTAIFATRDLDASILLDVCLTNQISVPEQVAILGVDNNELITESLQVPLSSVNHNVERLGYEGARLLAKLLNSELPNKRVFKVFPTGITSRRSTDCYAVDNDLVRQVLERLSADYGEVNLDINAICKQMNLTRRQLDRLFQIELGHSCRVELQNIRLRNAKKLLDEHSISVKDLAVACGFNTPQYFNLCFRQAYKLTPLAYRKRNFDDF